MLTTAAGEQEHSVLYHAHQHTCSIHRLQIQQVASGLCLSSLNGEASLVYQEQCKTVTAGGGPLPWQLWQLEAVELVAAGPAVQPLVRGGGGVYRILSLAGGWCMQVRPGGGYVPAEEPWNANRVAVSAYML